EILERALARVLYHVLGVAAIARQPARQVVRRVELRQHGLLEPGPVTLIGAGGAHTAIILRPCPDYSRRRPDGRCANIFALIAAASVERGGCSLADDPMPRTPTPTPSAARILERCDALARCSEQPDGLTRIYLSPEQRAASTLVLQWMRDAGMSARLDAAGNVVGRYEGERPGLPCLMLGSHLDTVRDACKYDGMLGVITAIECVGCLSARNLRLPFAVEVVGFADEEGVRFNAT